MKRVKTGYYCGRLDELWKFSTQLICSEAERRKFRCAQFGLPGHETCHKVTVTIEMEGGKSKAL